MIAATFHGANYDPLVNDEDSIEVFENIGHAISALFDRYDANGKHPLPVRYLSGKHEDIRFPVVVEFDFMRCYKIDDDFRADDSGPVNEGQILEALTTVKTGVWDYRLVLMHPFGDPKLDGISVSVQKH